YLRQRRVALSLGWKFAAATIPGAIIGAFLTRSISSSAFNLLFGIVLVAIAALLFSGIAMAPSSRAGVRQVVDASSEAHTYRVDVWKGIVVSLFVGFMSSILGIGGGIIHVPFLIVALSLPIHIATATSHFVPSISAFVGAATFLALGNVDLRTVARMGVGRPVGAQPAARASLRPGATLPRRTLPPAPALRRLP